MRKRALLSIFVIIFLIIGLTFWGFYRPVLGFAATISTTGAEFGIATDPPASFLKMENMAPGARTTANLTVKNIGQHDFSYKISAARQAGDESLYNMLLLDLVDATGQVRYSGSLSGLLDLEIGTMAVDSVEVLNFTVIFPAEAGNEFQGKSTAVQFTFAARSHEGDIGNGERVIFEPPVSNNHFALKIDSTVPIKFHLVKADGSLDRQVNPDLILEVTGPSPQGGTVTYTFRVSDGTLRFDNGLELPHYITNFATRNYPVQPLAFYTARVVEHGTELGSITFQANTASGTSRSNSP